MRMFMTVLTTAAALSIATSAIAAPTISNTNGDPLDNQIYGIAGQGTTVYGSSPNNDGVANVTFTGDTNIAVGSGFAQINDATPTVADFYSLIINPDQNFDQFKFSVMLTDKGGTVSVYSLLAGTMLDANDIANYTNLVGTYGAGTNNFNQLLSGGVFDGFAIVSSTPIAFFEVKQLSFNGVTGTAVPEPGTWAMMLLGLGAVGFGVRRKARGGRLLQAA